NWRKIKQTGVRSARFDASWRHGEGGWVYGLLHACDPYASGARMSRDKNDRDNRRGASPAHWQGQPVPNKTAQPTRDVGIDERGAGTARQYGRAGDLGKKKNDQEER